MYMRKIAAALATFLAVSAVAGPVSAEDDPVIARVNGNEILRSQLMQAHENLPNEYKQVPLDQIYPMLLTSLIDSKLVAQDAKARNLDEEEDFQKALTMVKDQLLERYAVRKEIEDAVTDEKLRQMYDGQVADGAQQAFSPEPVPENYVERTHLPLILRAPVWKANAYDMAHVNTHLADQETRYDTITVPTVILAGPEDTVVSTQGHAGRVAETMPNAELELIEGAGHNLHHHHPDRVRAALIARHAAGLAAANFSTSCADVSEIE